MKKITFALVALVALLAGIVFGVRTLSTFNMMSKCRNYIWYDYNGVEEFAQELGLSVSEVRFWGDGWNVPRSPAQGICAISFMLSLGSITVFIFSHDYLLSRKR